MSARRFYRQFPDGGRFRSFSITVKETDLWIAVPRRNWRETLPAAVEQLVWRKRRELEDYIKRHPFFGTTLEPYLIEGPAPEIVLAMVRAGNRAGVGPMAAVAGALAETVGIRLLEDLPAVIVENGGDIFLKIVEPVNVGIFAGNSPLSGKIALSVEPGRTPLGICTSSGTVGPSFSRGRADAAVALSPSAALADAAATALGNLVREPADLERALGFARGLDGLTGALLICRDRLAAWGDIHISRGRFS